MKKRKGIIMAGGAGTRLYPITMGISKQLLPIYDKPMIFYPLSVLMLSGIREIAIITAPKDQEQFFAMLGDGNQWGVSFTYIKQPTPDGLAQAYTLAENFLDGESSSMILGDNIFYGHKFQETLALAQQQEIGGTVFGYQVLDPERYGVVEFDKDGKAISIIEKPVKPASNYAVTGLYFLDGSASDRSRYLAPSERGELEITTLLESYLEDDLLSVEVLGRGFAWLDTGTHVSLLKAGEFIRTLQTRQGLQLGCPEEIAFTNGWISSEDLEKRAALFSKNSYGKYLKSLLDQ